MYLRVSPSQVTLCLFTWEDLQQGSVSGRVRLDPSQHRTGDVWHIFLEDLPEDLLYGYSLSGPNGEVRDRERERERERENWSLLPLTRAQKCNR